MCPSHCNLTTFLVLPNSLKNQAGCEMLRWQIAFRPVCHKTMSKQTDVHHGTWWKRWKSRQREKAGKMPVVPIPPFYTYTGPAVCRMACLMQFDIVSAPSTWSQRLTLVPNALWSHLHGLASSCLGKSQGHALQTVPCGWLSINPTSLIRTQTDELLQRSSQKRCAAY